MNRKKDSNKGNDKGSISFLSQNMQGYHGDIQTSVMSQLRSKKTDVAVIQESGSLPYDNFKKAGKKKNLFSGEISASGDKRTRSSEQPTIYGLHYKFTGSKDGNTRTSMTMLSNEKPLYSGTVEPQVKGVRPMMFMAFEDVTVANVHLPSGNAPFAGKVMHGFLNDLDSMLTKRNINANPVLILGDMNMDTKRANNTGNAHGFNVSGPGTATHQSGSQLDYAFFRGGNVMDIETQFTSSDHGNLKGTFKL